MEWNGKHVVILGGGRQGQAAARWLTAHGAIVMINDLRPPDDMSAARATLEGFPVTWVLGSHPISILDNADVLCISGGIPLNNPLVVEADRRKIPLTNDTQIFMELAPCKTIGITGSAGKTTTTALVGQMAKAAMGKKAFTGGNIGDPLLNYLDRMSKDSIAILELSSFQLEQMTISPNVAAILNITPNHLDRHGTMEAYTAAKQRILNFQRQEDIAILNRSDPGSWSLRDKVRGHLISFGPDPLEGVQEGVFLSEGNLYLRQEGKNTPLLQREQIKLRGDHNVMNVLAAFAIGYAAALPVEKMVSAVKNFTGIAHRLEFVRDWNGIRWFNDSIATAPERTIAAIRSFKEPIVLLLGGRDKNLPWQELVHLIRERVEHVVLFGEAAGKIENALTQGSGPFPLSMSSCNGLQEAVEKAAKVARPGSIVLLSPGCTSFDQFTDFEERGKAFRKWVSDLS